VPPIVKRVFIILNFRRYKYNSGIASNRTAIKMSGEIKEIVEFVHIEGESDIRV